MSPGFRCAASGLRVVDSMIPAVPWFGAKAPAHAAETARQNS